MLQDIEKRKHVQRRKRENERERGFDEFEGLEGFFLARFIYCLLSCVRNTSG